MATQTAAVPQSEKSTSPVLVLLCENLKSKAPWLDLTELSSWLSDSRDDVQVCLIGDLCNQLKDAEGIIQQVGPGRLVLGTCSWEYPEVELQVLARRAGIDPLGIQVVDLGGPMANDSESPAARDRAKLVLGAAVSRARAYPGSRPENLKTVLPSFRQRVSRRAVFTLPPLTYVSVPTIDRLLCAANDGCDHCVSACPFGALEKDAGTILVSRAECQSCGVCVTACPQRAVEFPGWSADEIEDQLSYLLETEPHPETRAVAFVCKNASEPIGAGWLPLRVPCASNVSTTAMLTALAHGADSVRIYACSERCPTGLGATVRGRVAYCQEVLRLMGDKRAGDRVQLLNPQDAGYSDPSQQLPPLPGEKPNSPIGLFGRGRAAKAVRELAARYGVDDLSLEHPDSPLGMVQINAQTCTGCETCVGGCPTGALSSERHHGSVSVAFDPALCIGCGKCVSLCPEQEAGAISMTPGIDLRQLSGGPQLLFEGQEIRCERCGGPIATRQMLDRIAALLGDDYMPQFMEKLCQDCRGIS